MTEYETFRVIWPLGWFEVGEKRMMITTNEGGNPNVAVSASKIVQEDWDAIAAAAGSEEQAIANLGVNNIQDMR